MVAKVGGRYRIRIGEDTCEAVLRGRLKREAKTRILVGDVVTIRTHADGSITIEQVHARRSLLKRRAPGRKHGVRNVAANVDQVVVVGAADQPAWDFQMMDRFTAIAAANDLPAVVVVNKCDLVDETALLGEPYLQAGYAVAYTSVIGGRGLDALRRRLLGHTSLFTGPTGVGKSSLLNALQPGLKLRTAAVSERSRGGRHTTVSAEMHALGNTGFVVDTPGLRDIGLWGLAPVEVAAAFPEFACRAAECRFDDCRHLREPDCAVAAAAERGEIAASRLDSYRRMLQEASQASRPWSPSRAP